MYLSGPSHCHQSYTDEFSSSIPYKRTSNARNRVFDGCGSANLSVLSSRCKIPFFGSAFHVSSGGHDLGLTKVSVAADYSDSVPDSSFYGYHPLEDLKPSKRVQETKLSASEVARTTVEVYSRETTQTMTSYGLEQCGVLLFLSMREHGIHFLLVGEQQCCAGVSWSYSLWTTRS